ncbi:MAG: WYL domain-containing protein [Lachnospiraceae bacterium]|nr:WYL domain-containing protein [Lachnospiraceae bacterium]
MAKGQNQKLKLYYIAKILLEKTDEDHGITREQIEKELARYEVSAERKSIYSDITEISEKMGLDIAKEKIGRETFYKVLSRDFELAEVKILIDAVLSSRFITQKKSNELIKKIKGLVSEHQAKQLQRQVYVQGRIKTMNETIYYSVDDIHAAIAQNRKIRFKYLNWNIDKELVPRHHGDWFVVSPWVLTWDNSNYYLVAYDDYSQECRHYRVDKMTNIEVTDEMRDGKEMFDDFDIASYAASTFGMYQGRKEKVHILVDNKKCGIFFDRFGKEILVMKKDETHSELIVDVNVSRQFYGWIYGLGEGVKVIEPQSVVEEIKQTAKEFLEIY